jgi:hypothetical protein
MILAEAGGKLSQLDKSNKIAKLFNHRLISLTYLLMELSSS